MSSDSPTKDPIRIAMVLCGLALVSGCSSSPSSTECSSSMSVSVHTPASAAAFDTTEAAIDLAGAVLLSDERFFETRVTVVVSGDCERC